MKFCLVGATGLVGCEIIKVLENSGLPVSEFYPVASARTLGKPLKFKGKDYFVMSPEEALSLKPDIAIFSAGRDPSLQYAPRFSEAGVYVIDNSSAWRMDPKVPLVVPEINSSILKKTDYIIANPNCSTIQMVMVLNPLHRINKIKRIVVSTYQSVTGTGIKAVKQLQNERAGIDGEKAYPYQIDLNVIPHIDLFQTNGYTKEEMKMINETRKIMDEPQMPITSTTVRIPVLGGHSESVNIEFEAPISVEEVRKVLTRSQGVVVMDNPAENIYPMPLMAAGKDEVFVGRIRMDESIANGINLWIVADNLRKGAATNAVQIAEYIFKQGFVNG
jgi:aspartate-semialdehyde dehydrogenase